MVHSASLGMLGMGSEGVGGVLAADWAVGGLEVREDLGWSDWGVEVPEPPQEREESVAAMARQIVRYFMSTTPARDVEGDLYQKRGYGRMNGEGRNQKSESMTKSE